MKFLNPDLTPYIPNPDVLIYNLSIRKGGLLNDDYYELVEIYNRLLLKTENKYEFIVGLSVKLDDFIYKISGLDKTKILIILRDFQDFRQQKSRQNRNNKIIECLLKLFGLYNKHLSQNYDPENYQRLIYLVNLDPFRRSIYLANLNKNT